LPSPPVISSETPFIPKPSILNNPFLLTPGERSVLVIPDHPILAETKQQLNNILLEDLTSRAHGAIPEIIGTLEMASPGLSQQLADPLREFQILGELNTPEGMQKLLLLPMPPGSNPLNFRELVFGTDSNIFELDPNCLTTTTDPNFLATTAEDQGSFETEDQDDSSED
jgi:hypothetical protein